MKLTKKLFLIAVSILAAAIIGFVIWGSMALQPMPEALRALNSTAQVSVRSSPWLEFTPTAKKPTAGFILYPGARVDPRAYAPQAQAIAEKGYLVVIPAMPINFAIFGENKAAEIITAHPEVKHWVLSGHSLGGVMAATYSKQHPQQVEGLVFLASYPTNSDDLSQTSLKVTSIYASQDGLATQDKIDASRPLLPANTDWVEISGGNHAQFGWYGLQPGDNPASITHQAQQEQVVAAVVKLLASLDKNPS